MKINKLGYILLGMVALLLAFASLGMARTRQAGEIEQLEKNLALTRLRLEKIQDQPLITRKAELEASLQRAQAKLDAAKVVLRQDIDDIDVSDSLFQLARESDVRITELHSSGFAADSLQAVSVTALPLGVTVTGQVPDILRFINKLGSYSTGMVKDVSFSAQKMSFSATIQFSIYSYRGK